MSSIQSHKLCCNLHHFSGTFDSEVSWKFRQVTVLLWMVFLVKLGFPPPRPGTIMSLCEATRKIYVPSTSNQLSCLNMTSKPEGNCCFIIISIKQICCHLQLPTGQPWARSTSGCPYLVSSIWILVRVVFFCQFSVCLRTHKQSVLINGLYAFFANPHGRIYTCWHRK